MSEQQSTIIIAPILQQIPGICGARHSKKEHARPENSAAMQT